MTQDHTTRDGLQEEAENFLNFQIRDTHGFEIDDISEGMADVYITIPADESSDETFYHLRICEVCGNTQAMNYEAFRKNMPTEARDLLEKHRYEAGEKYKEAGIMPPSEERLKEKIETAHLNWDNNQCEQRHPPRGREQ